MRLHASGRPGRAIAVAVAIGLAAVGFVALSGRQDPPQARWAHPAPTSSPSALPSTPPPAVRVARAAPTRLRIPALHVDAPMMTLGIAADGTVEVPPLAQTGLAGWYEPGPSPGEEGSAVVIGHVDNRSAPAVFFGLRRLRGGEAIEVERADGSIALFLVDSLRQVSKGSFPTDEVYSESGPAVLRLITCGGSFDRAQGSYRDNLIVTAHFAGLRNSEK